MSSQIWSRSTHAVRQTRPTIANTAATAFADASIVAGFQPTHPTPESKPRNSFAAPRPPSDSAITLTAQCGDPA